MNDETPTPAPCDVTELLVAWSEGNESALEHLIPLVESELRCLAGLYMRREGPGHTLQTTALVNEAYLRIVRQKDSKWQNRTHFFAASAQSLRMFQLPGGRSALLSHPFERIRFVGRSPAQHLRPLVAVDGGAGNIWRQKLNGEPSRRITQFSTGELFTIARSNDGSRLGIVRGNHFSALVLITDFQ